MKSNYEILGIGINATESEIKLAYKHLAKVYHPDLNKNIEAKDKFIEINKAYTELLNPTIDINNMFGIEIWYNIVKVSDFWIYKKHNTIEEAFKYREEVLEKDENYLNAIKKYYWTLNKVKLLNKLYKKIIGYYHFYNHPNKEYMNEIITHLNSVLNDTINIKAKISKPIKDINYEKDYNYSSKWFQENLVFKIKNQLHPKFINKFPTNVQFFIHSKIAELINYLETELKNINGDV